MEPLKATAAACWLVKRESVREAPNYFLTTDFRRFEPMTALIPQKDYNWLSAELVDYRLPDGLTGQGILYKPEDFDPAKKYPVLLNIYERYSHRLYEFPPPGLCRDNINIPWFVSRGYLVFTPDIQYLPANVSNKTIGDWAAGAVIAAVMRLKQMSFVDAHRLGIQGHSLGAEETNDVLEATGVFSAAIEMAGPTDPISAYLTLLPAGYYPIETRESQYVWEQGQGRMGVTPWQRPDLYLHESAVLHADRITTPLLIVHNPQDAAVQGRQGVELFMALRRLKKPVWLLQYAGEDHSFFQRDAALDYTRRITDFFGYFLKGCAKPAWMEPRR
jgi:dipeptidyl aminopeptidase/acylaminoacyl peptidase